jgi:hypothetical protein
MSSPHPVGTPAPPLLLRGGAALLDRSPSSLLIATKNGGN